MRKFSFRVSVDLGYQKRGKLARFTERIGDDLFDLRIIESIGKCRLNSVYERIAAAVLYLTFDAAKLRLPVCRLGILRQRTWSFTNAAGEADRVSMKTSTNRGQPHLVYRMGFTEALEIDKWLGGVAERHNAPYTRVFDREEWGKFKAMCVSEFGADKLEETRLTAHDAATASGAESYYDSYYRGYCSYTHGALETWT
jgi:hypothetical protein